MNATVGRICRKGRFEAWNERVKGCCLSVCLCVSVTNPRSVETAERIELGFGTWAFFHPSYEEIRVPPKIRVLSSDPDWTSKNFSAAHRSSQRAANLVRQRQTLNTVVGRTRRRRWQDHPEHLERPPRLRMSAMPASLTMPNSHTARPNSTKLCCRVASGLAVWIVQRGIYR